MILHENSESEIQRNSYVIHAIVKLKSILRKEPDKQQQSKIIHPETRCRQVPLHIGRLHFLSRMTDHSPPSQDLVFQL